jgi:hypothetical protein
VLAVLFTLPRLRTLRPATLRKLSNEGTWRNDAEAVPARVGKEENPVFDFGTFTFTFVFGGCAYEYVCGCGCLTCGCRDLPAPVNIERDCDLWECDDRTELDDRREVVEWEAYGDRRADEGEGGCAGESGGDCGRGGDCGYTCVPRGNGPEIVGRAAAAAAAVTEEMDRDVVAGDLRVRLMSRFRPFVCCPCPCPCASSFPFDFSTPLFFSSLPLPRTLAGVGVLHTSRIRTPRRYIAVLPSGSLSSSRFELTYDSEESISMSMLSTSIPISCMPFVLLFTEACFVSSSSMTSQYPMPSW